MKKEQISSIIYEIILSSIGIFGIVSVPLTCILSEVSLGLAGFLSVVAASLWVGIFHMCGTYRVVGIVAMLGGSLFYSLINMERMKSSVIHVIYAFTEQARRESGAVLTIRNLGEDTAFNASLLFVTIIIVGIIVALEVALIKSMAVAIITILPFLAIFITFSIIPGMVSFLFSILYVFGVSASQKGNQKETAGYMMLIIGVISYICVILCVPQNGYERRVIFSNLYTKAESLVNVLSESLLGTSAAGGINYGQLGKINEVKFSNHEIATVTTIETGRNQYFKTFTGGTYDSDQWLEDETESIDQTDTTGGGLITQYIFNMMDVNARMQEYVTGESGNTYYNHTKFFTYMLRENAVGETKSYNMYSVTDADYQKFKNIADGNAVFDASYTSNSELLNQTRFMTYEAAYRRTAANNYCKMSTETRALMAEILGTVNISSYKEKVFYIESVKAYLEENYTYTVKPGRVPEGADFLEYFLRESKEGYCTYFATAATMMFRYAGIPARYCEGYVLTNDSVIAGSRSNVETYRYNYISERKDARSEIGYTINLTDRNAHAWVEIYMDGYGWIPIEVTPGNGRNDSMADAQLVNDSGDGQNQTGQSEKEMEEQPATEEATTAVEPEELPSQEVPTDVLENVVSKGNAQTSRMLRIVSIILTAAAGLLLVIGLIIQLRKMHIKKKRYRLLTEKQEERIEEQISDLYDYLNQMLEVLGYHKPSGMDYEEYIQMLEIRDVSLQACGLSGLMASLLKARFYQEGELTDAEFRQMTESLEKLNELVYERTKGAKRFAMKYFDAL